MVAKSERTSDQEGRPQPDPDLMRELLGVRRGPKGPCAFGRALAAMPADKRAAVEAAWEAGVTASAIASVLRRQGLATSTDMLVRRHFQGLCLCHETT